MLPDGFVGGGQRQVQPLLRQSQFGLAMLTAAELMGSTIAKAKGVELDTHLVQEPPRVMYRQSRGRGLPWPLVLLGIIILFAALSRFGRRGGGSRGFGGGGGGGRVLPGIFIWTLRSVRPA